MWEEVLLFLVPFRSRVFDVFLDFVILPFLCNFYGFLCGKVFNLHLFCVISMFVSGKECLYKRFKCFMNFNEFSMYLFTWKRGGGALMHVYVWEHIVSLYYRTAKWMFTKLGRHEALMVPYKCCCFSARSVQGRIQGGAKVGHGGPLLQRTSASDWKAIATNWMHSNDLEACCYFWFHSKVKFMTCFRHLFGLIVILPYFNAISVDFYAV